MSKTTTLSRFSRSNGATRSPAPKSFRIPDSESEAVERFYSALDCPRSLACWMLYHYKEHDQLVSLSCHPNDYNSPQDFQDAFWATSYLSKYPFLATSFDRREKSLSSFWESETRCREVNNSFRKHNFNQDIFNYPGYCNLLSKVRSKIGYVLGRFNIDAMLDACRFGPGVSTQIKGDDVSASRKYNDERGITRDAHALFESVLKAYCPRWITDDFKFRFERGTRVITVPKNAKTDRTIGVEPGLNLWLQLGAGSLIRRALLRQGVNLNDDTRNQESALQGSRDDSLATEDFRQASDSISTSVVEHLLPHDWFVVLNAIRSHCFSLDGESWTVSSKFSTMGNGFTFELESLIFYSLAHVVTESMGEDVSLVSIFGDDVILPSKASPMFRRLSALMGFHVNSDKSFNSGPFRESCGSYFYDGVDVKPLYLRGRVTSLRQVYTFLNGVRRLASRSHCFMGCDKRFQSLWNCFVHKIPVSLRRFGPLELGDSVITENPHQSYRHPHWDGWLVSAFPVRPVMIQHDGFGHLLARLRTISTLRQQTTIQLFDLTRSDGNDVPLRGHAVIFQKKIFCIQWCDLGPWL